MKSCFQQGGNCIFVCFSYTSPSLLYVHIFCPLKYYHLRAVDGQRMEDRQSNGPASPFMKTQRISNYAFGRYIAVLSNLNALYLGFLFCSFMSLPHAQLSNSLCPFAVLVEMGISNTMNYLGTLIM